MKKVKYNITIFLLLTVFFSRAQIYYLLDDFYKQFTTLERGNLIRSEIETEGSPYEKEDFIPGNVLTRSKVLYVGIPLRYNIYNNEMEYQFHDRGVYTVGNPEIIDSVYIGNDKYIYGEYTIRNKTHKGYLKILAEREPALLQKMNVNLKPAEPPQAYKEMVPPKFERERDDFFFEIKPGELVKINDKKDVVALWGEFSSELEHFIRSNRIRFNEPADLVKLAHYCYSLNKEQRR